MLAPLWMVNLSFPTVWAQMLISSPYRNVCRHALLSDNDIVLEHSFHRAHWYFSSSWNGDLFLLKSTPNIKTLPGGSLLLISLSPQPSQTGLYCCLDDNTARIAEDEIDFQYVTTLRITHKILGPKPLENETLSLSGKVHIFAQWEPWQDRNHCGKPGEHSRLGYCYMEMALERHMACWLYLRNCLRPDLQVEAYLFPCDSAKETNQPYFVYDFHQLSQFTRDRWLTCSLASIYRPVHWEANNTVVTWQCQLSGRNFGTSLNPSTSGRLLRVFRTATYRGFMEQELLAQFNPRPNPEMLWTQNGKLGAQGQQPEKAGSVLKGLKLMLLMGTALALVGPLLKVLHHAQGKKSNCLLLVR
uniref:Uncharacterized protein n=1 Tax=Jaculus jaculus TaxID=51337 RepID=A0A8C5KPK0_JACJA